MIGFALVRLSNQLETMYLQSNVSKSLFFQKSYVAVRLIPTQIRLNELLLLLKYNPFLFQSIGIYLTSTQYRYHYGLQL